MIAAGVVSPSGHSLKLNWMAGAMVHLQSATNLSPPFVWTDLANTARQGAAVIITTKK